MLAGSCSEALLLYGLQEAETKKPGSIAGAVGAITWQKKAPAHRAKWATLYLTMVDEDGKEVVLDPKGEWEIFPYKSAADEYGQ